MSTRPTEPGNYHWRFSDYTPWQVVNVHRGPTPADGMLYQRPGIARGYPLTEGIWGPRIDDPTEPGEIPAGGLTDEQIIAGIKAADRILDQSVAEALETHSRNNQEFCAHIKSLQVAAFRAAVAELREPTK